MWHKPISNHENRQRKPKTLQKSEPAQELIVVPDYSQREPAGFVNKHAAPVLKEVELQEQLFRELKHKFKLSRQNKPKRKRITNREEAKAELIYKYK